MGRSVMDEARRKYAERNGVHQEQSPIPANLPEPENTEENHAEDEAGPIPPEPCPEVQTFPVQALPNRVCQFVMQQSQAIDCDVAAVALPVLAVLGGTIGLKRFVSIKPGKGGWHEFPIIWADVVAPSGTAKSPAWEAAVKPVTALEADLHGDYKIDLDAFEKRQDGDDIPKPIRKRILISDVTMEWLAGALQENPNGLLLARDELDGWVRSFNQYKGRGADLPNWLQLHRGGQLIVDRKNGTSVFVKRAGVSICGTTQPQILRTALNPQARASGLGARLLLAMLPKRRRQWTEAVVQDDIYADYERIVRGLYCLTWIGDPIAVPLSPEAKRLFIQFFSDWNDEAYDLGDDLAAAFAKLESYAPRFALIHHLVTMLGEMAPSPVSAESMEAGITLARWFGQEAKRIYAVLDSEDVPPDDLLIQFIRNNKGQATPRELMRWNIRKYPTAEVADLALQRLVKARIGNLSPFANSKGGPASWVFTLNGVHDR